MYRDVQYTIQSVQCSGSREASRRSSSALQSLLCHSARCFWLEVGPRRWNHRHLLALLLQKLIPIPSKTYGLLIVIQIHKLRLSSRSKSTIRLQLYSFYRVSLSLSLSLSLTTYFTHIRICYTYILHVLFTLWQKSIALSCRATVFDLIYKVQSSLDKSDLMGPAGVSSGQLLLSSSLFYRELKTELSLLSRFLLLFVLKTCCFSYHQIFQHELHILLL